MVFRIQRQLVNIASGVTQRLVPAVVSSVQYGVVIPDYEMSWPPSKEWPKGVSHVSRPTRNKAGRKENGEWIQGLPATLRSEGDIIVSMTKTLQEFLHRRSCARAGLSYDSTYAKSSFASFTRGDAYAYDFAGSDTHHDHINKTNIDQDDIKNKVMWTSGALLKILGSKIVGKVDCWVVSAINVMTDDVWKYTEKDVDLWYTPITSRRENFIVQHVWGRENIAIPFHMYDTNVIAWNFSNDGVLYAPKNRVRLIKSLEDRPPVVVR